MRARARLILAMAVLLIPGCREWSPLGLWGIHEGAGEIEGPAIPEEVVEGRSDAQRSAATSRGDERETKQILFGDLHVHTTFSADAFLISLPIMQGEGAHPVADACDYARYCSALDFWSINDHAEASTPRRWQETVDSIRQCNAIAGDEDNPDLATFLGWEWTQVAPTPEEHYGHKNVILRNLADGEIPTRPIAAAGAATTVLREGAARISRLLPLLDLPNRQRYLNLFHYLRETQAVPPCAEGVPADELPSDCFESAETPADLFRKLREWEVEAMVIPHGNSWGFYTPPGASWDKQLRGNDFDPELQPLVEIMSGHGNSEEYRDWRAIEWDEAGSLVCPAPTPDYLPSCHQAGELVRVRCLDRGETEDTCDREAAEARSRYAALGTAGHLLVPDADITEWLDSGQCRDCFLPSFNHRPGGSTQYALALRDHEGEESRRFRFGIIASSDIHTARPGTGYKELDRPNTTEASGARSAKWRERLRRPLDGFDPASLDPSDPETARRSLQQLAFFALETERQASFFTTGGLAAVHSEGRGRDAIWQGLERREVYGTSGDRILLWFDLLNADPTPLPMGSELEMSDSPRFRAHAVGAFRQKPGCPEHAWAGLPEERLRQLCKGECYHPSDERKLVTRIEVIRIRPRAEPDEPVGSLIEDPWRTFPCEPDPAGCVVEFEDPDFPTGARDTVYYVRAIEEPSPAVNGAQLRCSRGEDGECLEVQPCFGDYRTELEDDCLASVEERAWSSPIFVDWASPERETGKELP